MRPRHRELPQSEPQEYHPCRRGRSSAGSPQAGVILWGAIASNGQTITLAWALLHAGARSVPERGTQSLVMMQPRDIKVFEKAIEGASLLGEPCHVQLGRGQGSDRGPAWPLTKSLMRVYGSCSSIWNRFWDLADARCLPPTVNPRTRLQHLRQFRQSEEVGVHGRHTEARRKMSGSRSAGQGPPERRPCVSPRVAG